MKKRTFVVISAFYYQKGNEINLWFQKREEDGPLNGLLEFPGGKIEKGETPMDSIKRECEEEMGILFDSFTEEELFKIYPFDYDDRSLILHLFLRRVDKTSIHGGIWCNLFESKLKNSIPEANHQMIDDLQTYFREEGLI